MLTNNKEMMNIMYREFSSRFCAFDFNRMISGLNSDESWLILTVNSHTEKNIAFLQQHNYIGLIGDLLMYCELTDNLRDACKPFISDEEFERIQKAFRIAQKNLSYYWQTDGLALVAPSFFVDIVLWPISQFHSQIIMAMEDFHIYDDGLKEWNVFLNAKTPSFFTQFSQYWVMEKINKINVGGYITIVI